MASLKILEPYAENDSAFLSAKIKLYNIVLTTKQFQEAVDSQVPRAVVAFINSTSAGGAFAPLNTGDHPFVIDEKDYLIERYSSSALKAKKELIKNILKNNSDATYNDLLTDIYNNTTSWMSNDLSRR